jgi:trans-aconitate 2-methyltransferase
MTSPVWDPHQYLLHAGPRLRPVHDLLARVPALPEEGAPGIADLGCGPGGPSLPLAERWPGAHLTGYDNSPAMLHEARAYAGETSAGGRLDFTHADLSTWRPEPGEAFDLLFTNAALHWVIPPRAAGQAAPEAGTLPAGGPEEAAYADLFRQWTAALRPGGVLAFSVPGNFDAPSHVLLHGLRNSPRWQSRLGAPARAGTVLDPAGYVAVLTGLGYTVDAWETTYAHVLHGRDPVLDWVKGTALRPVLAALEGDAEALEEFLAEYGALLREAYPPLPGGSASGTVLPFRRVFAVAVKGGAAQ